MKGGEGVIIGEVSPQEGFPYSRVVFQALALVSFLMGKKRPPQILMTRVTLYIHIIEILFRCDSPLVL